MPRFRTAPPRRVAHLLAWLLGGVLVAALAAPTVAASGPVSAATTAPAPRAAPTPALGTASAEPVSGLALGNDRLPDCAAAVAGLSARDRLAQRLMVGVGGGDPTAVADAVHRTQVGGIFVDGNAVALFTGQALRAVQATSRLPLAVAVDDEGGRVQRIDALVGDLPSARTLAATRAPGQVQQVARDRARELVARGITMNMAPDVDVTEQPARAVIGDRSFGQDADTVTAFAGAYAQGQREAGMFTVLKHFPGHGHASGDSHRGRVTTPPLDRLKGDDLRPYAALLGRGGPLAGGRTGVMVGHLDVPGLTDRWPSTLTPAAYRLLRDEYDFDGLVLTDDLGAMKAISGELALPQAVESALAAGADMALWTSHEPAGPVLDGLAQALAAGRLDARANDAAAQRVLAAKGVCSRR